MELYQEIQNRTGQTVAVANAHAPGLAVGGKTAAALLAQANGLDALAQARDNALVAFDEAVRAEFRGFQAIRLLVLKAPALIEAQLDPDHPAAGSLDKVYALTPRNTENAVARGRALLPVWRQANTARAAAVPPQPAITRNGLGVADLETLLTAQPALEQAVEDTAATVKTTRGALLTGAVAVDGFNKRFYKALKALADPGSPLETALGQITTEHADLPETLGIRSVLQGGEDGRHILVAYENGTGEGATARLVEWQVGGAPTGAGEFTHSAPADPSGNALGPFAVGETVRLRTRTRNANGTRTGSVRTVTLAAPLT